jgi:hypothetical protein
MDPLNLTVLGAIEPNSVACEMARNKYYELLVEDPSDKAESSSD